MPSGKEKFELMILLTTEAVFLLTKKEFIMGDPSIQASDTMDSSFDKAARIHITIGANVFQSCANLRSVTINVQVEVIGNSAFSNCTKLTSIKVYSTVLKTVGNKALKGVHDCRIGVVKIRLKKYRTLFKNRGQGKKVVVTKM